jgi:hypothetical protein
MQSRPPGSTLDPSSQGQRPIKLKGTSFQDAIAAARRREGERRYDEIVASLPPEHRSIFEGRVVPTNFYSLDAFVAFLQAGFQLSGEDERLLIRRSEAVAEYQLGDTYRSFVRRGAPQFVIQRIATIHQTFFVGAQVQVQSLSDEAASIRYVGFRKEQRLIEYIQIGFYRKALELCGARNIVVEATVSIAEGREYSELSLGWRN